MPDIYEIDVYDVIGSDWWSDGVTAKAVARYIAEARSQKADALRVKINSPGGDVFDGVAIYNQLRRAGMPVEVVVEGLAASAASVIAMAGDTIRMEAASLLMIHEAWGMSSGPAEEHETFAATLRKITGQLAAIYAAKTGLPTDSVLEMLAAETWMSGEEAVALGFATEAASKPEEPSSEKVAATWSPAGIRLLSGFRHQPSAVAAMLARSHRQQASAVSVIAAAGDTVHTGAEPRPKEQLLTTANASPLRKLSIASRFGLAGRVSDR